MRERDGDRRAQLVRGVLDEGALPFQQQLIVL